MKSSEKHVQELYVENDKTKTKRLEQTCLWTGKHNIAKCTFSPKLVYSLTQFLSKSQQGFLKAHTSLFYNICEKAQDLG